MIMMGPVTSLNLRTLRSRSIFLGVAAMALLLVAILGWLPASNAKLLPREDRKPPVLGRVAEHGGGGGGSKGFQNLQKMLRARSRMHSQGAKGGLEMGFERFQDMLFDPPRNYGAFVMLYSGPERCGACGEAVEALDYVANAYMEAYSASDSGERWESEKGILFFVKVRITGGNGEMPDLPTSRPGLFYFAPSPSPKFDEFEQLDRKLLLTDDGGIDIIQMLKWIQFHVPDLKFNTDKEETKGAIALNLFAIGMSCTISLFLTYYLGHFDVFWGYLREFNFAYFLTFVTLWLLSGQMFNYMRGTSTFGTGSMTSLSTFIYPGSRHQYGIESVIVMFIYALMVYGVIELIKAREIQLELSPEESITLTTTPPEEVPRGRNDKEAEYAVMSALSCIFFAFLALLVITNLKGYR